MTLSGFQPPETRIGQIAYMIYKPHFSKKRGVWVPGSYENQIGVVVDDNFDAFYKRFQNTPDVYDEKGKIPAMSPGMLARGATQRQNRSVQKVTILGVDLDQGRVDFEHVWRRVHELGVSALFHTTWSHLHPGKGERFRCFIELAEAVAVKDWPRFWRAAMLLFTGDADGRLRADRACIDPARVYYVSGVAPGFEHTYWAERIPGVPLPLEEVWEAAGVVRDAGVVGGDRVATITTHRALLAPARRRLPREDLEALAKDKKRVPDAAMRAAFKTAAAGSRMVIVKGEGRGPVLSDARAAGLFEGDVDPFLTSLMYRLALYHRNPLPEEVDAAFAASFGILVEDDTIAGNTPYTAGSLGQKFLSAVRKIDEEEVERAEVRGVPTAAEFKAEVGVEEGQPLVLRRSVFAGKSCYYKVRAGDDGEPDFLVLSNFLIIPKEKWKSKLDDGMQRMEWRVDFLSSPKNRRVGIDTPLPNLTFGARSRLLDWSAQFEGHQWDGTETDTQAVGVLLDEIAEASKIPTYETTPKMGIHVDAAGLAHLVTPQGTYECKPTLEPELSQSGLRYAPHLHDAVPNPKLFPDMMKRRIVFEREKWARYAQLISVAHVNEVIAPLLAWFASLPLAVHIKRFDGKFPLVQVLGEPGSGKSTLISLCTRAFGGPTEGEVINEKPKFSMEQLLSGSTTYSMHFDEYRPSDSERKPRVGSQREVFRSVFNNASDYRAGMGAFTIEAPVLVSGEERIWGEGPTRDQGLSERTIMITPGPDALDRAKSPELARHIMTIGTEIMRLDIEHSGMWIAFQAWVVGRFGADVPGLLLAAKAAADVACAAWPKTVPIRIRDAIAVLCVGAYVWEQWCIALGVAPPAFTVAQLAQSTLEEVTGVVRSTEGGAQIDSADGDKVALALEQVASVIDGMSVMQQAQVAQFTYVWTEGGGGARHLFVNVAGLMEFYRSNHIASDERVIKSGQHWYRVAKGSKYVIEVKRRRDGDRGPRGSVIDVDALLAADVELGARLLTWERVAKAPGVV